MDVHVCKYPYGGFVLLSMIICLESPIAGNRTSTFLLNYICFSDQSSDHVDLPTFIVVTEVGKGFCFVLKTSLQREYLKYLILSSIL